MESWQNKHVVWLLFWNTQSTACDIMSNLKVGQNLQMNLTKCHECKLHQSVRCSHDDQHVLGLRPRHLRQVRAFAHLTVLRRTIYHSQAIFKQEGLGMSEYYTSDGRIFHNCIVYHHCNIEAQNVESVSKSTTAVNTKRNIQLLWSTSWHTP